MRLEDVPELMQQIQLRLPEKEAVRTSVLSKSWLHAWSTIPTLRFHVPDEYHIEKQLDYIDHTLKRYLRNNIPIQKFDLIVPLERGGSSLAEKWIRSVATKTCVKELSLGILFPESFSLPSEIFAGENLTKIRVSTMWGWIHPDWMTTNHHPPPIINCVSLRKLHLSGVHLSQQALDHILSSCRLLVKIKLRSFCRHLKTVNVKNLPCLDKLEIHTENESFTGLDMINKVPSLPLPLKSNVTQLSLGGPGLVTDDASLAIIKSGFPCLESLTLSMIIWTLGNFHFTCNSPIKRLSLMNCSESLIDIQVNAPKLLFFSLDGTTMPSLSFPISTTLEEIKFHMFRQKRPFGASFFLKMREALELSSKCYVDIVTHVQPLDIDFDLDDLKTRLKFPPAMNMQSLSCRLYPEYEYEWHQRFFDAFFEICHPKLVSAKQQTLRKVLKKKGTTTTASWPRYLKNVQIRTMSHTKWETLTDFPKSFLDELPNTCTDFKFEWSG